MNAWVQKGIGGNAADVTATILSGRHGRYGYDIFADTADHAAPTAGGWCEVHAITSTVFSSVTLASNPASSGSLAGVTLSAGQSLYIQFTAIKLTSGSVICYRDR